MNAIRPEIIIPILTFVSVIAVGASILVSRTQKRKMMKLRLQDNIRAETDKPASRKKSGFMRFLEKVGNLASHGHATTSLWEQLIRAGYLSSTNAPAIYTGIKMILFVFGLVGMTILLLPMEVEISTKITFVFLGGVILFFVPNIIILMQLKKRHDEIRRHLPDAIDLLEICVSSGIGLDMAWNIVADEMLHVSPVLANAMALSNFEIHLGVNRVEAMRHMAERTGVEELSSLAAILVQTDRFGTSIGTTLRVFAVAMREERSFMAQENAEKMAVKLILPMVLFIFPAVLVILVGPAAIAIATQLLTQ